MTLAVLLARISPFSSEVPLRTVAATTLVILLLGLSSCAVPFGPGYQIEKSSLDVRYVVGTAPQLRVRAAAQLRNIGTSQLRFVDVALPSEKTFGRRNVRAWVDDREVAVQPTESSNSNVLRIPFDPPWPPKKRRAVVLEYDLAPPPPGHAASAVGADSFHIRDAAAFPLLLAPEGNFVERGRPVNEIRLSLNLPRDFRVFAPGRHEKARQRDEEIEHRFRIGRRDPRPFVVAGRYQEQQLTAAGHTIFFWTTQPLPAERAQLAAARLGQTLDIFRRTFDPLSKDPISVRLIETSASLAQRLGAGGAAGVAFSGGALLNREAFALDIASDTFLNLAEHELAHAWFGHLIEPRLEAQPVLGEGLAEYAMVVAGEARQGEEGRRRQVALLLRWFDESSRQAADRPLLRIVPGDPYEQRVFGYSKGALFFIALEDEYGKDNVRRALARLVGTLRGQQFGYAELLSALELETGKKPGNFFRLWLNQTGIPEEFRQRFEVKAQGDEPRE